MKDTKEHSYIFESEKDVKLVKWGSEMDGKEKASALGWPLDRIIKTVYFQKEGELYGVMLPTTETVDRKKLKDVYDMSTRKAKSLKLADTLPYAQKSGSAGPFICDKDYGTVKKLVFMPGPLEKVVDFSYPGKPDKSIHMTYKDAIDIVTQKYGDIVKVM